MSKYTLEGDYDCPVAMESEQFVKMRQELKDKDELLDVYRRQHAALVEEKTSLRAEVRERREQVEGYQQQLDEIVVAIGSMALSHSEIVEAIRRLRSPVSNRQAIPEGDNYPKCPECGEPVDVREGGPGGQEVYSCDCGYNNVA